MIVRTWHGCVPLEYGDGFARHLHETGIHHSRNIPGNLGAFIRRVRRDDYEHFFLVTYWESLDAVRDFAGPDHETAVSYPGDEGFFLIADPIVLHHEVLSMDCCPEEG